MATETAVDPALNAGRVDCRADLWNNVSDSSDGETAACLTQDSTIKTSSTAKRLRTETLETSRAAIKKVESPKRTHVSRQRGGPRSTSGGNAVGMEDSIVHYLRRGGGGIDVVNLGQTLSPPVDRRILRVKYGVCDVNGVRGSRNNFNNKKQESANRPSSGRSLTLILRFNQ